MEFKHAEAKLKSLGYRISRYSPGDGVTRYRVLPEGAAYFEHDGFFTALGKKEFLAMTVSFLAGINLTRNKQ